MSAGRGKKSHICFCTVGRMSFPLLLCFYQRYISLRYLTNFVLNRDMQQEVHDSIEDAWAAHQLYKKSLDLKQEGKFNEYLNELYARGHLTQFKLGIGNNTNKIS